MKIPKILCLSAIVMLSAAQYISDDVVYKDMATFFDANAAALANVRDTITGKNNVFDCNQANTGKERNAKYTVDTGAADCSWEIAAITINCSNSGLSGLQFDLRNAINPTLTQSTPDIDSKNSQSYTIPKDVYITKVTVGTTSLLTIDFVVALSFALSNGQTAKLVCSNPRNTDDTSFSNLERITGFYGAQLYNVYTSLGFLKHNVVNKTLPKFNSSAAGAYYTLVRSDKNNKYAVVSDNFVKVGPYGATTGSSFEDPYLYGHWNLGRIALASDGKSLLTLQSSVVNTFFFYVQVTEIHGNDQPKNEQTTLVTVPDSCTITSVEIMVNSSNKVCGIRFYFSNNTSSAYIGQAPNAKTGVVSNKFTVKANQEIMGFFGFETDASIEGLGLIVVEKNSQGFYY